MPSIGVQQTCFWLLLHCFTARCANGDAAALKIRLIAKMAEVNFMVDESMFC